MLIIFDMGGVVTNTFKMDSLYEKLNISRKEFFDICKNGDEDIWRDFETGVIEAREFWNKFNQKSKEKNIPQVHNDLFRLTFHPSKNPETIKIIQELKAKGHRVVCGTNTIQSHWENHLERGDYSYFNQTYASNKIGVAKPDLDFFRLILDAEGYKPEDSVFTDDKIENVEAAKKIGINAFHFSNAANFRQFLESIKVL